MIAGRGVSRLFPFDGCGRFAGDVVHHAGDAVDLVDDAVRHMTEEVIGQMGPVGCHKVDGLDGAQGNDPVIFAAIAHDADGAHR